MDKCNICNGTKEVLVEYEGGESEYRDCHCIENVCKIYLVVGSSHSYDDTRSWNHCACESAEQAKAIAEKLNEELKLTKEKNKLNLEKCNEICDEIEEEEGKFCECNCNECEWQFDYMIEEEHGYHISSVDYIEQEMS